MGTRADFYVGRGPKAEWLGSIAWDGYPAGLEPKKGQVSLLGAITEKDWREAVKGFLASRPDASKPEDGWPWPWNNSNTTDYAYAFDGGKVWGTCFGHGWWEATSQEPESSDDTPKIPNDQWPDMRQRSNVQLGSRKSGVMIIGIPA